MQAFYLQKFGNCMNHLRSYNPFYKILQSSPSFFTQQKFGFELQKSSQSKIAFSTFQSKDNFSVQSSPPKIKPLVDKEELKEKYDSEIIEEDDDLDILESDDEYLLSDSDFSDEELDE